MFLKVISCRLCASKNLTKILSLKPTPLANNLFKIKRKKTKKFPLNLLKCNNCGHIQLSVVINEKLLFKNYNYLTGISSSFVKHFSEYAKNLSKNFFNNQKFTIVDIGSNDGLLLKSINKKNIRIAVEPALNLKRFYKNSDIFFFNNFFNATVANEIKKKFKPVDVVTANNVFAHIDDLRGITKNVSYILKNNGLFIIEFSYLLDMLKSKSFDNIYHEHLSYHTLIPLIKFFHEFGFNIINIKKIKSHGGSLRVILKKTKSKLMANNLNKLILAERLFYNKINQNFQKVQKQINFLENDIKNTIKQNNFVGYGCPAKLMTFIFNINLNYNKLIYIVDDNKFKQNKYIPIYNIKILSSSFIPRTNIKYILIYSWNVYKDIVLKNRDNFKGKTIIIPLPKFKVIKC